MKDSPETEPNNFASSERSDSAVRTLPTLRWKQFQIWVVHSIDELETHLPAWNALSEQSIEPNPFYEPWNLLPALRTFGSKAPFQFVLIYEEDIAERNALQMCGFFPFTIRQPAGVVHPAILATWNHNYSFLQSPLIRGGSVRETWEAVWHWLTEQDKPTLLRFDMIPGEGELHEQLVEMLRGHQTSLFVHQTLARPILTLPGIDEDSPVVPLTAKQRQECRRKRRRLDDLGECEFRKLTSASQLEGWLDQFLTLEASGWKGKSNTAIRSLTQDEAYLRTITQAAFDQNQLDFTGLFLNDKPIAMKLNLLSGETLFGFKICYDEAFKKYSPGVLLELESTKQFLQQNTLTLVDSCTWSKDNLVYRLWKSQRTLQSISFSGPRNRSTAYLKYLNLRRLAKNKLRRSLKPATHK